MKEKKYCNRCSNKQTPKCSECTTLIVNGIEQVPSQYIDVKHMGLTSVNAKEFYTFSGLPSSAKDDEDVINHPSHYQSINGLETIDVIEAFTNDLKGMEAVDTGNVIKYICRWKYKNGIEDLKKAQWYINHLIELLEEKEKNKNEK